MQAGGVRIGVSRIGGLADEQGPAGPLGEVLGDGAQEALVGGVEHGPTGLAVETEHAPDLAGRRLQPSDHLLIAAHGLVETPAMTARGVAVGGLVQGGNPGPRPGDVGHLVHVVAVVFVRQPLGGKFRHPLVEMAGGQQRRRIEGVPARRPVVRDDRPDHLGALPPVPGQVARLAAQPGDLVDRPLQQVRGHHVTSVGAHPPAAHTR